LRLMEWWWVVALAVAMVLWVASGFRDEDD